MQSTYLKRTAIADLDAPAVTGLVRARGWATLNEHDRIGAAYTFVKDEIAFGYNRSDDISASEVLHDGYGQCNTKGNLLVALLRALDVPCRVHGFTIDKQLQRGAIPRWLFRWAPARILHSWVEVFHRDTWIPLEGFIIDRAYLSALQARFSEVEGKFCGYGVATTDLHNPGVEWTGQPTFIQREGIADDFGLFDDPDALYEQQGTNLTGLRRVLYTHVLRHAMNATVARLRRAPTQIGAPRLSSGAGHPWPSPERGHGCDITAAHRDPRKTTS